jgi:hypothetical protein
MQAGNQESVQRPNGETSQRGEYSGGPDALLGRHDKDHAAQRHYRTDR